MILARFFHLARQARRLVDALENSTPFKRIGRLRIVVSSEIDVPLSTLLGGHAWVALPEAMLGRWSDSKLAVRHEVQHHRQRDTAWAILIEGIVAAFFANPAAYLWRRRIHEFQELSCDEALIGAGFGVRVRKLSGQGGGGSARISPQAGRYHRHGGDIREPTTLQIIP